MLHPVQYTEVIVDPGVGEVVVQLQADSAPLSDGVGQSNLARDPLERLQAIAVGVEPHRALLFADYGDLIVTRQSEMPARAREEVRMTQFATGPDFVFGDRVMPLSADGGALMTSRVVQWTTGNVGRRAALAVLAHPDLDLVGCYVTAAGGKSGTDIADLLGLTDIIGVNATDDIDALLALQPDCVVYTPKFNSVDEMVRILTAGVNMVTTSGFITGHCLGAENWQRILAACEVGGSSIFGSGMNPGFANLLGLVATNICDQVRRVSVLESIDSTGYDSPETERPVGFGRPIDDPALPAMVLAGTGVFEDAVRLTAEALSIELDDVRCESEFAETTESLDLGSWNIDAGCVAGITASWQGIVGGDIVIDLRVRWRKGQTLRPDWHVEHGYVVDVVGMPSAHLKYEIQPPADFAWETLADFMVLGMIATALPAVQAIPVVCAARPGIVTYLDLTLRVANGFATSSIRQLS